MPGDAKPPTVNVRRVEDFRVNQELTGWSAYRIFAGAEEIGKLAGSAKVLVLSCPGVLEHQQWYPSSKKNAAPLIRVVLPLQTDGLSDEAVLAQTEVHFLTGLEPINQFEALEGQATGLPAGWDQWDLRNQMRGRTTPPDYGTRSYRLDVALGDARGSITYRPAEEVYVAGERVSIPAEISITHDPELLWGRQTMEFLLANHASPTISSLDPAVLGARVTETSLRMAAQFRFSASVGRSLF